MNGEASEKLDRRALGRALSCAANASVRDILASSTTERGRQARRIGITGPPGAGKSTVISVLARYRLERAARVAVIAIDPSSPKTHGSVLGDRIRMDGLIDDSRVYIRSLASRGASNGLAENLPEILAVLDEFGFDEIILETVGVGQSEFAIRDLVDVEVLVMTPGAGDQIQAMKAGIVETADIYVINKSDQPGASRAEAELRGILSIMATGDLPPIVQLRADAGENIDALDRAIETCLERRGDASATARRRAFNRLHGLLLRRLHEAMDSLAPQELDRPVGALFEAVIASLPVRKAD